MKEQQLTALLDHLGAHTFSENSWQDWQITRIEGGHNNILYRATSIDADLAIKFTRRDERDRAGREFTTLLALQQLGLTLAPVPVWLDRDRYTQPVVVQTWLKGEVRAASPATDDEWHRLLEHFATIHTITPDQVKQQLSPAIITLKNVQAKQECLLEDLERIPVAGQPPALRALVAAVAHLSFPTWPDPVPVLCRSDPNTLNLIRRPGAWASVDWENSGWGDPAFEIADLLAHPAYLDVSVERRMWVIDVYSQLRNDTVAASRIHACHTLMLVNWAIFFARKMYEMSAGVARKQRLVDRPPEWYASFRPNYERYLELATACSM